jgi:hypothetical protein
MVTRVGGGRIMDQVRALDDFDDEQLDDLLRAARMYEHLRTGGALQPIRSIRLGTNESAFVDETVIFSRYYSEDPFIERPDSYLSPRSVAGSMLRNWSVRKLAEAQWRHPQRARAVLTDYRLMVLIEGQWLEFAHENLVEFQPAPADFQMIMTYHGTPALRLTGRSVPTMAVAAASVLEGVGALADIPGFELFDAVLEYLDTRPA